MQEDQDQKILGKLRWLCERSKRDYKGNPSQFEERKTRQTVEQSRQVRLEKNASEAKFLPFWHGPPSLAEDSVPLTHLRRSCHFAGRSSIRADNVTVRDCLVWQAGSLPTERKQKKQSAPMTNEVFNDPCSINCMSPAERAEALRRIRASHPKVNHKSIEMHYNRWQSGSQLQGRMLLHS